jgi:hypothetical protein
MLPLVDEESCWGDVLRRLVEGRLLREPNKVGNFEF